MISFLIVIGVLFQEGRQENGVHMFNINKIDFPNYLKDKILF